MIYESLRDNVLEMARKWGAIKMSQLVRIFIGKHSMKAIEFTVRGLIMANDLYVDEATGYIRARNTIPVNKDEIERRIKALSVLASFGEANIRECYPCEYPVTMLFVTESNDVFDITIFDYDNYGGLLALVPAVRERNIDRVIGDNIMHIALCADKDLIPKISALHYDTYCVLNEADIPSFYQEA